MKLSTIIPTTIADLKRFLVVLVLGYIILVGIIYFQQRSLLFHPTHNINQFSLTPWKDGLETIGFCREVSSPNTIWLMMHGNGGQASDREYVLSHISDRDSFYVLEYPGYGSRAGKPTMESMNQAASDAYKLLRSQNPNSPVCVLGESIGSGPACSLSKEKTPPDKIVLLVPFDSLASVASQHFPYIPVRLLLHDNWDNVGALSHYSGPVEIFGAKEDTIIPIEHARALATQIPNAHLVEIPGGHNDWSDQDEVRIAR